jgi:hypothetical protein
MKQAFRWLAPTLLVLSLVPAAAQAKSADVTITNHSDWDIHHLFMSPVDEEKWGPDQLGEQVIAAGAEFVLQKIPCSSYDIKLVDEDGDECVVPAVDVCGHDQHWQITSKDLLACESASDDSDG